MNSVEQLLAKAKAKAALRTAETVAKYRRFVVDAASGKDLSPDEVVDFLDAHGLDINEYQAAVELRLERIEKAGIYTTGIAGKERMAACTATIDRIFQDLDAAVAKLRAEAEEKLRPLRAEHEAADIAARTGDSVAGWLRSTAPDDVKARITAAHQAMNDASNRVTRLRAEKTGLEQGIARQNALIAAKQTAKLKGDDGHWPGPSASEQQLYLAKDASHLEAALREFEEGLARLPAKIAAAEAEHAAAVAEVPRVEGLYYVA